MLEFFVLTTIIVLGCAFGFVMYHVGAFFDRRSTRETARQMGVGWRYSNTTGAMIEIEPGKWIPLSHYRYNDKRPA